MIVWKLFVNLPNKDTIIMIEVHFDNIERIILERLSAAKSRVFLAVAWFTNEVLFKEILRCCKKRMDVCVIILDDYINRNEYALNFSLLIESGGRLFYSKEKKMHNKYCIIDDLVITGSYNWTYYAENLNLENIIESDDTSLIKGYIENFNDITKKCIEVTKYEQLLFSELTQEDMYYGYKYLCNDIALKGQEYNERINIFNNVKNIAINLEGLNNNIKYDNRGIPILKKEYEPSHLIYRLNYLSIGVVPNGRPNSGRKYVHAKMTSNCLWEDNYWVDIFDSEYVKDVLALFHVNDGGIVDNSLTLPSIPEEIYNPRKKYHFGLVHYIFYKYGSYGNKRHKYDTDGKILCNKEGKPYEYDHFDTLIRFDVETKNYIEFGSMTELCNMIVQSLFSPNEIDDFDSVSGNLKGNGAMKATIDDYKRICLETEGIYRSSAALSKEIIKARFHNNPDGFWVYKVNQSILSYAYGVFNDNKFFYPINEYESSHCDINGKWFILLRLKDDDSYNPDKYGQLLNKLISDLKQQGKIGLVYYCAISEYQYFEKFGFNKFSQLFDINGSKKYRMELSFIR